MGTDGVEPHHGPVDEVSLESERTFWSCPIPKDISENSMFSASAPCGEHGLQQPPNPRRWAWLKTPILGAHGHCATMLDELTSSNALRIITLYACQCVCQGDAMYRVRQDRTLCVLAVLVFGSRLGTSQRIFVFG